MNDLIVIGGGVAGLVAAWQAAEAGREVTVLEARDVLGGPVSEHVLAGLELDAGTESFATRGGRVAEMLEQLGLSDAVVEPNPAGAWVGFRDAASEPNSVPGSNQAAGTFRAEPLPATGLLGIPGDLDAADLLRVLDAPGLARAQRDRDLPAEVGADAASLGDLVEQRMGRTVVERLVTPVAGGVYSADPYTIQVDAVAPGLREHLLRTGSLAAAVRHLRSQAAPGSAVRSLKGGMHMLVRRLKERIEAAGGRVITSNPVRSIHALSAEQAPQSAAGVRYAVETDGEVFETRSLVVATEAEAALPLLAGLAPELGEVTWPAPALVTLVTLVVDAPALDELPRGTGILIAPDAPDVVAKAMTHASAKWRWAAEAAASGHTGRHLLRLSYGHAGAPSELSDEQLRHQAVADARVITGVDFAADAVVGTAVHVWRNAQPYRESPQTDRAIDALTAPGSGMTVVGSWRSGTGLASVMPQAYDTVRKLLNDDVATAAQTHRRD